MKILADLSYKSGKGKLPIMVVMHGISGTSANFIEATKKRFAENNVFAIFPNMRGRNGSEGTQDCSARELHDIIDTVEYIKANYADYVNPSQIHIVGYSGGGANALNCAVKFPDYFNSVTSFFGISDYGHNPASAWYQNGASADYKTMMETWISGNPTTNADGYHARAAILGIGNYKGYLHLFHDSGDTIVPVINSQKIIDLNIEKCDNVITSVSNAIRWTHGYPNSNDILSLIYAEPKILEPINKGIYPELIVPTTGTLTVLGYVKTKRFSIWLGGLTEAAIGAGLNEVATVEYNINTGTYTITPLTGAMDVFIKQGSLTVAQNITEPTTLTVI